MVTPVRVGIVGCGHAARIHIGRLLAIEGVQVVGCADANIDAARLLAKHVANEVSARERNDVAPAFADHRDLLRETTPTAAAIFTPHLAHYRPAMDALQTDCHVFIEKPLSTNVQEAADIVNLARARSRKLAVGHQYRLLPSLVEARARCGSGAIGPIRLVSAILAAPWLAMHGGAEDAWRLDPKVPSGGILADAGDHLLDALLWTTGAAVQEAAAFQARFERGPDLITAAAVRLTGGIAATVAISGVSTGALFEIHVLGENGRLRATDRGLWQSVADGPTEPVMISEPNENIDGNFIAAIRDNSPICCTGEAALETVRLLEAVTRSAATGQVVKLT
jgi:predicted dehydrogenase